MNTKKIISVTKPLIIIVILVLVAFTIRAQAYDINGVGADQKSFYINDEYDIPYFSEMDSYYNYRLTNNYIQTGMIGDTIKDGKQWDEHSYAPEGRSAEYTPMIVYVTAFFYKVANYFDKIPLMEVAFWTGAIISSLSAIPAYLFVRRITNDYGGITAGFLVALAPNLLGHSYAGFFDTDMFVLLLACSLFWFFTEAVLNENRNYRIIYAILAVITLVIFSQSWVGYIFFFGVLAVVSILYLIYMTYQKLETKESPIKSKNKLEWLLNQKELLSIGIFLILGFVTLGFVIGFDVLISSIEGLIGATGIQDVAEVSGFPNVYTTVGELQLPNLAQGGLIGIFQANTGSVISGIGGILVLLSSLAALGMFVKRYLANKHNEEDNKSKKDIPKGKRKSISQIQIEEAKKFIKAKKVKIDDIGTKNENAFYIILFTIWLLLSALSVTRGTRFILILGLPVCITAAIFVGFAAEYIKKDYLDKYKGAIATFVLGFITIFGLGMYTVNLVPLLIASIVVPAILTLIVIYVPRKNIKHGIIAVLLVLTLITPTISGANALTNQIVPGTDDGMWHSMEWIKDNTNKDAVITSWWDFGHMFIVSSNRSVTFDGGSQTGIRANLVGKAFSTTNESLSAGIFTMLGTSGDKGFYTLINYTGSTTKSSKILDDTLGVDRETAKKIMLKNGLSASETNTVLNYTHPTNPREVIVITSADMIPKGAVWIYFGNWNFDLQKTDNANRYSYMTPQQIIDTGEKNTQVAIVGPLNQTDNLGTKVWGTGNNTNATLVAYNFYNNTTTNIDPYKLTIINDGYLIQNNIVNNTSKISLYVLNFGGQYQAIAMNRELDDAMFTRMYLFGGMNLTRFTLLHQEPGVMTWKVNNPNAQNTTPATIRHK